MDNKENNIIKRGPSKKDELLKEKEALEKELRELSGVSEAQIGYKKARIKLIDKQIQALDAENGAGQKQSGQMSQEQMMAWMRQNQDRAA